MYYVHWGHTGEEKVQMFNVTHIFPNITNSHADSERREIGKMNSKQKIKCLDIEQMSKQ